MFRNAVRRLMRREENVMKRLMIGASIIALLTSPVAMAQPGRGHGERAQSQQGQQTYRNDNGRHRGWAQDRGSSQRWRRGQRMGYNDWNRAQRVDYRRYNLRQPPRGYEWRRNNDRFILVAVTTGLIMSVILSSGR
jgi:Ni/Co efflux regulator RcnB